MSIFGRTNNNTDDISVNEATEFLTETSLQEAYIYDELARLSDGERKEYLESAEGQALQESGLITKKTLVRLTKEDDLSRRMTMAALQLEKEAGGSLFDQLKKNRIKERDLLGKILKKHQSKAMKIAKAGQKTYIKSNKVPLNMSKKIT